MRYSLISLQLMRPCNCACRPSSGMNLAFEEVVCCLLFVFFFKRKYKSTKIQNINSEITAISNMQNCLEKFTLKAYILLLLRFFCFCFLCYVFACVFFVYSLDGRIITKFVVRQFYYLRTEKSSLRHLKCFSCYFHHLADKLLGTEISCKPVEL